MKQRSRTYYTNNQKALMWEHWRKGNSLQQTAQFFDRNHSSIQHPLQLHLRHLDQASLGHPLDHRFMVFGCAIHAEAARRHGVVSMSYPFQ